MNPWTQVLDRIWYYLQQGPASGPVLAAFPAANRYGYDADRPEPDPPESGEAPVLIVDQSGGRLDLNYSPKYLLAREEYQVAIWSADMRLPAVNDLRMKVLAAVEAGLPDLGLDTVLEVRLRTGRITPGIDRVERFSDGRSYHRRRDLRDLRRRAGLIELIVSFLIDRDDLAG